MRRVIEASQLVINVLKPGGMSLAPDPNALVPGTPPGQGIQSTTEVRLMHAAIRHLIRSSSYGWDRAWGQPINQEDLAGTLMTFSTIVLRGFEKLNVHLSSQQQDDFIRFWSHVRRMMGIHEDLLPQDYGQAKTLFASIARRQLRGSELGRSLMAALLGAYEKQIPVPFSPRNQCKLRLLLPWGGSCGPVGRPAPTSV